MVKAYLKLIRWPNLLIIGLIFVLTKSQIVGPISDLSEVESCIETWHWVLLTLATILIAASGNVINDIFDQDIDFHNKPNKIVVVKVVSVEQAWNLYYALGSFGLGLGIFLCWRLGNVSHSIIFMMAAGGLYFYSYVYKRQFLIGNITVAILAGLVPFLPLYLQMMCVPDTWLQLPWTPFIMALSAFAFLSTLIREIIKDMEDLKGDQMMMCSTLPIVFGINGAKIVVVLLLLLLIALVGWLQNTWWIEGSAALVVYFAMAVQVPAMLIGMQVFRGKNTEQFHLASTLAKVLILGGILSMIVFNFTLE